MELKLSKEFMEVLDNARAVENPDMGFAEWAKLVLAHHATRIKQQQVSQIIADAYREETDGETARS